MNNKYIEEDMNEWSEQEINRVFKEVTLPQLKKLCEWYAEDTGKKTSWIVMLMSCVGSVFEKIYNKRGGLFNEETSEDDEG